MANYIEQSTNAYIIKKFLSQVFSIKLFYIISFIVCFGIAFMVNRYSRTIYEVHSVIGPIEDQRSLLLGSNDLFRGLSSYDQVRNLENDINNIKSFSLISNTLNDMNLEVGYFVRKTNFLGHDRQLYPGTPFIVSIDKSHVQPVNARFDIEVIDRNSYRITSDEEEISLYNYIDNDIVSEKNVLRVDTVCKFNETISNPKYKFAISLNPNWNSDNDENNYFFLFYHMDQLARNYLDRIMVKPVSIRSSLINISLRGENINLTLDFLNRYVQSFLDDNLAKKNKMSFNAVNFIDSQISGISDSLQISENRLRDYRSANKVMDLSYQGQRAFEQMTQVETNRSQLEIQERYYNSIIDHFEKNKDVAGIAPPTGANISDPIMNSLILDLMALNSERSTIAGNSSEKNLFLGQLDNKIRLQKEAIIENVRSNLNTLVLAKNELDYRARRLSQEISRLPRTELNMVSMQRKFNVSDAIYTFLLQKRTEAAITAASNHPDYEILEPARAITRDIISPKPMLNYMFAVFFALFLPTLYLILKNFFNDTITSVGDAEFYLKKPVIGTIYRNNLKTQAVVTEQPASTVAESFRNLRSRLFLKFKSHNLKLLIITSSQPRDGKSFISYNIAASIASVGHKTVLLDCDLRRPTLHSIFKLDNNPGVTNYLADDKNLEKIIQRTGEDNLYFIPAGPILPNSSEMIEAGALDELITYLKNHFAYIIIDSPPIGLVSEATQLMKYASHILFVCRNNYTRKDVYNDIINMFRSNKVENYDVVFNDMDIEKSKYGRYRDYYYRKEKVE
jgi:tyrosine-protein kinase Etk/Wzc